jgi:high-affinity Fe2+/Pb2+ permease
MPDMARHVLKCIAIGVGAMLAVYLALVVGILGWFVMWGSSHNAEPPFIVITAIPYAVVSGMLVGIGSIFWVSRHNDSN